ncbi:erv26 superfamily protein [Conglomerata obtusa]
MFLFEFIKSISVLLGVMTGLLSLGIGLYKAVEYIEDKTFAAKKKIEQIIIGISIFHLYMLIRGVSKLILIYSLVIQYLFYSLLDIYPNIQPSNPVFIAGSVMALGNHFLMLKAMILGNYFVAEMIIVFVVGVWCTPFCFFLSLSANDEALPVKGKKANTWIKRFISNIIAKKEALRK